jgi:hypothetical protein
MLSSTLIADCGVVSKLAVPHGSFRVDAATRIRAAMRGTVRCSFCGKTSEQVQTMIAGQTATSATKASKSLRPKLRKRRGATDHEQTTP